MIVPSQLPILIAIVVDFGMNWLLGPGAGIKALGGVPIGDRDGPVRRHLDVHGRQSPTSSFAWPAVPVWTLERKTGVWSLDASGL